MENKNIEEKKTLESLAYKELFDRQEVEQFLHYCEDKHFLSRSEEVTERFFRGLLVSSGIN